MLKLVYLTNVFYYDLLHYVFCLCFFIPVWVVFVLSWQIVGGYSQSWLSHEHNVIESVWTAIPSLIIGILCSYNLQCASSEVIPYCVSGVKVVGRQWYWSYEVVGETDMYDSLMLDFIDSVDKPLRLYTCSHYQLLITSSDVIHSFAVPKFNLKVDAIPGRINQVFLFPERSGVFVGYCSELCGAGHAYMPIVIEVLESGDLSDL